MTALAPEANAALEPVRKALRAAAEEEAAGIRSAARRVADKELEAARTEAARILATAAAEGEAAAAAEAAARSARARRQAHELVLGARTAVRVELRRRVREAAAGLAEDPRYPELMTRLREKCHELLGPDAVVSESPEGGVVAVAGARRLDLTLPVLAELRLDSLPEAGAQWSA
ncbi:hypothetical protein KIH31_07980 [Paenarthrobacter sp. DKR-5]|uniref:V-type ATP synthase subunit E family protein n=1 Tax=Paenarthrobacter sp. DKR-5 TaxID=2835535 RepID=UPI001BDC0967|nr:V-type ATP synthase subunit E family protein [Paenarthrobacter sp. DKR-5]MBT1002541.1 hypothetical protein [Paenarthrobacter sp. DKR-5]